MFHPLIKMLATKPDLLAEHVGAYAELAAAEAAQAVDQLQTKAIVGVAVGLLALIGILLGGVALLIAGALPLDEMPAPWLLWLVPAVPLLGAAGGVIWMRSRPSRLSFALLREQMAQDNALMQQAANA